MTGADHAPRRPPGGGLADGDNWAFYLEPEERLLGTWRPVDAFRPYGTGKSIMAVSAIAAIALLIGSVLLGDARHTSEAIRIAAAVLVFGIIMGLGPARLDQINRRARRYAVSDKRALEFQDIRNGRLKSVRFGPETRVLKLYNDNLESCELAFGNIDGAGKVSRSVLFERLTDDQVNDILRTLWRAGVVKGSAMQDGGRTGLRLHRKRRTRI